MKKNKTLIAIDFGTKYLGLAVGQSLTKTASPLTTLRVKKGIPDWQVLLNIFDEWEADCIVVGLPLNMDGSEQDFTQQTKKFIRRLQEKTDRPIFNFDERLTTVEAKSYLFEREKAKGLKKERIDALSAVLILESFLQHNHEII